MFKKHSILQAEVAEGAEAGSSEKPKLKVTMQDGRTVEFPESTKAKKAILYQGQDGKINEEAGVPAGVRWDFVNGQTRSAMLSEMSSLNARLSTHGLSQKGGDEYAALKDVDDCVEALDDLMGRLKKGEWSEAREGGALAGISVLAKALVEFTKKSIDEVRIILKTLSPKEKTALRQAPGIREIVARIEADKAAGTKVDTSALLAKFGG